MAKINLSKAAEVVGKNRTTIWRHVKTGKLSIERDRDGLPFVDTSELIRVYGEIKKPATATRNKKQHSATELHEVLLEEIKKLRAEQAEMKEQLINLTHRLTEKPLEKMTDSSALKQPEDDPHWPKEIKTMADLTLRREIREKYRQG